MDEELMVILSKDNRAFETAWFNNMKAAKNGYGRDGFWWWKTRKK